jgi:hypothetical protein
MPGRRLAAFLLESGRIHHGLTGHLVRPLNEGPMAIDQDTQLQHPASRSRRRAEMKPRLWLTRHLGAPASAEPAAQAEDWLRGRADMLIGGMRGQVPVVAQLGVLAHADLGRLADLGRNSRLGAVRKAWGTEMARLAGDLAALAATPDRLVAPQRDVLVPLELAGAGRPRSTSRSVHCVIKRGAAWDRGAGGLNIGAAISAPPSSNARLLPRRRYSPPIWVKLTAGHAVLAGIGAFTADWPASRRLQQQAEGPALGTWPAEPQAEALYRTGRAQRLMDLEAGHPEAWQARPNVRLAFRNAPVAERLYLHRHLSALGDSNGIRQHPGAVQRHDASRACRHARMDSKAGSPVQEQHDDRQPADQIPASGPDTGSYEVIHLGGQAAVVVPVSDFLRLQALEQAASARELADAEDKAALADWRAREAAGQTSYVPHDEALRRLGLAG